MSREAAAAEVNAHEELFDKFFDRLPKEFIFERELLRSRLWRSPERWELAQKLSRERQQADRRPTTPTKGGVADADRRGRFQPWCAPITVSETIAARSEKS